MARLGSRGLGVQLVAAPRLRRAAAHGWLLTLYERHAVELCGHLRRKYGPGPPEPEDIAQEAFVRLAALPDAMTQTLEFPKAFLYRIAENLLNTERRKRAVRIARAPELAFVEVQPADCTAERIILAQEQLAIVEAALRAMPARRRQCFLMHRFDELSFADIGRRLGISANGVKGHVERAMAQIAHALQTADSKEGR